MAISSALARAELARLSTHTGRMLPAAVCPFSLEPGPAEVYGAFRAYYTHWNHLTVTMCSPPPHPPNLIIVSTDCLLFSPYIVKSQHSKGALPRATPGAVGIQIAREGIQEMYFITMASVRA